jgi:ABC-type Fe3+-hydroxamate transport system substrate-binding protein
MRCWIPLLLCGLVLGCQRQEKAPATRPSGPTVASLVPSATDAIVQMGAADQLVGVSNYEPGNPQLAGYPRVGDYHVTDWEKLSAIRPTVMVIPRPKDEMVGIFQERSKQLGVQLLDVHVDRLEDIFPVIQSIGTVIHQDAKAAQLVARVRGELRLVTEQAKGKPPVRTLIVLDENASFIVGSKNYLDDIVTMAGGVNVAGAMEKDYPNIDREELLRLDPDAVIQLLSEATPQVLAAAQQFWTSVPQLKAVRNNRIYVHSEWYLTLPSARVGETARLIVNDLHPLTNSGSTTTTVTH